MQTLFDFSKLSTQERYKLLSFTVVPRPIAWVVTLGQDGSRNAAPFSFFNVVASDPPLVVLGLTERHPHGKDTLRHITETRQFVVNLVPRQQIEAMNITAIEFGPEVDELDEAGLSVLPSHFVKPPRIAQSPVAFECELYQAMPLPSGQAVLLGKVLAAHINEEAVLDERKCYIKTEALDLVGRMNNRYLHTQDVFDLPRISVAQWRERS